MTQQSYCFFANRYHRPAASQERRHTPAGGATWRFERPLMSQRRAAAATILSVNLHNPLRPSVQLFWRADRDVDASWSPPMHSGRPDVNHKNLAGTCPPGEGRALAPQLQILEARVVQVEAAPGTGRGRGRRANIIKCDHHDRYRHHHFCVPTEHAMDVQRASN